MSLALIIVALFGATLIAVGLYYQVRKSQLKSDPVLITTCYLWGILNIGACIISQAPQPHQAVEMAASSQASQLHIAGQ
mgnify:CR=1 FL=1